MSVDVAVWGDRAPSVAGLEHQLALARRSRATRPREQGATVARAVVASVVVLATREVHALRAARTIAQLALRHPSRAVVVLSDRHTDPSSPRAIELHARAPSLDHQGRVDFEQILVRARGQVRERLMSVIEPLLVPDLPVFAWWTGTPPVGSAHFADVASLADRLVVDSADFARPEALLPDLARTCFTGPRRCAPTDLNWARLTAWRELLTQFFDVPAWRALLPAIDGVRVSFAVDADGREIHPSQALLFVAWLASRLGWSAAEPLAPSEAGGLLFAMRRGDGANVRIRIRPRFERGMGEGDVSGIRVEGEQGGVRSEFRVHALSDPRPGSTPASGPGARPRLTPRSARPGDDRPHHVTLTVRQGGRVATERIVPLPPTDVVALLGEELTILASDRIYEDALAVLLTLS